MVHTRDLTEFVDYIKEHMRKRSIEGVRSLAAVAEISPSAASKILRGQVPPRAETLKKLAHALQVSEVELLRLAGHVDSVSDTMLDPSARYIAQRLTQLPDAIRETAIDAVSGVVDSFSQIAEEDIELPKEGTQVVDFTIFPEEHRELISHLAPVFQEYLTALIKQDRDRYMRAMASAMQQADAEMQRRSQHQPRLG